MDTPAYQRFATLSDETFREASNRSGVPVELLMVGREATGGAVPTPDDRIREDELVVVSYIRALLDSGIRPRSVERELRVLGDGMRRLAATQGDAWRTDLMEPMLARGASVRDIEDASVAEGSMELEQTADEAIIAVWHAHQAQAWGANIIAGFESILTDAGLLTRPSSPPAICFLDITGYTRLTQEQGDEAAADLAASLNRLVTRTSLDRGGRPVKWLGDGVMVHFREPGAGVLAALEMVDGVGEVWAAARPRRPACRPRPVPGRRLLRADGEHCLPHCRVRAARRGARHAGSCRGSGRAPAAPSPRSARWS